MFDSPALALVGGLLVALVMPAGAAVAATSGDADSVRGGIVGVGLAALVVGLPPAVAGFVIDDLHPSAGPWIALVGVALLVPFAFVSVGRREQSLDEDVDLPGRGNLHIGAGVVGLVAAASGLVAVALPLLSLPDGAAVPENYAIRLLTPASILVGVLAVGLLVPAWAALVRPAFTVACAGIALAVASGFDNVLSATGVITSKATPGAGVWFGALAVLLALVAVIIATLAGALEREDVDLSELASRPVLGWVAAVASLLAIGAFGFPAVTGPEYESAGLWTFRIASTGAVVAVLAVIAAAALAARSRPSRGAALLFGAAGVAVVRALEFVFTGARAAGSVPSLGTWLAVACALVLVVGGFLAMSAKGESAGLD
ncbi:LigA protein [Kutzneria sp. 744]|nr:LigA protein [Kutzneria sp. 744]